MADKCATECPNGRDDECPDGEICWGDSPCALIEEGLEDGANGTSSAGTFSKRGCFGAVEMELVGHVAKQRQIFIASSNKQILHFIVHLQLRINQRVFKTEALLHVRYVVVVIF